MRGLDNEVEILFFATGSTLAKAGERNTGLSIIIKLPALLISVAGLFYVIEGFLDILLPAEESSGQSSAEAKLKTSKAEKRDRKEEPRHSQQKLLLTVKPGGIAGYLGGWQ
jgi:lysophospholipid hydrolase